MKYYITCLKYPDIPKKIFNSEKDKPASLLLEGSYKDAAQSLADAILLYLPCSVISEFLGEDLTEDERSYIISNALSDIYSDSYKLSQYKKQISSAYLSILTEYHCIDLFGAIFFRLPHIFYEWKNTAILHEKKLRSGENTSEILEFLSLYANTVISDIPYAKIVPDNNEYLLLDKNSVIIDIMPSSLPEFYGMVKEDILLSRLINLSPAKIDAALVSDPQLKLLLFKIFNERILF